MSRLPKPTYLPLPMMLLLQAMVWLTESQIIADRDVAKFLSGLPLGWMWVAVGSFILGLFLQDLYNPKSWIRRYIGDWRRVFRIDSATFPHDSTPEIEWLHFIVRVRFAKVLKCALSVRITYLVDTPRAESFVLPGDWTGGARPREVDELQNLTLATFPLKAYDGKHPGFSAWGSQLRRSGEDKGMRSISHGTRSLVEITARSWRGTQTERVLMIWPYADSEGYGRTVLVDGAGVTIEKPEARNA